MGPLVVLAYSGGLDTSAIVPWLKETYDARVLCFAADVGQGAGELEGIEEKAMRSGAVGCVVKDLREEFVRDFIFPTIKSGAIYARQYLLGTAIARPVIARAQVDIAKEANAETLAHGCTGKGNDQVRFELNYGILAPEMGIIAPWREWSFTGRADLLEYLARQGIEVDVSLEKPYSRDRNLWHCSHEGGLLEDLSNPPPEDLFLMTTDPSDAPDTPQDVRVEFDQGEPISVDGVPLGPVALIEHLNEVAGTHGIGRADIVEDRLVGMKSRGVYETPAGTILRAAHRELEQIVLDRRTLSLKDQLAPRYADMLYEGRWWTGEREAMDALFASTQQRVTGDIEFRLFKGNVTVRSRRSPYSLYSATHVTFEADDVYNQADAGAFIRLYGLQERLASELRKAKENVLV